MARKKIEENNDKILLSQQEVWDVLTFAQSMYPGILTPMLLNQRMKDVSLNPLQATEDSLADAMQSPKDSELALQAFSQDFEIQSQPYKRLLSYLGNLLAFDFTYESINCKPNEYKSPKYQKDLDILKQFTDSFDYKKEFTLVTNELLRNEAYFCCPRYDGTKVILQEMPSSPNYTMITGRWDYGLLYSLNMYWFIQPGVDIDLYPPFFKKKYNDYWVKNNGKDIYVPSLSPTNRGNSSWVYWQDIPVDVGWCWKMNPSSATRLPFFSGLFLDLVQQGTMRALQKNINMSVAARLIIGQVGRIKDATAKIKDQFDILPQTLGQFLALVKSAIGDSIKVAAAPLENMQQVAFPAENAVYNSYLKNTLATSGVNTNLIFTSDLKMNTIETQLSLNVDEQLMNALYPQFEDFMNYHINKLTKNYKFRFHFEGTQFFNDRQRRLDTAMTLASIGVVLPQKIAAAIGMNPITLQRQLEECQNTDWVDKLTPIVLASQISKEEQTTGRPQKKDSELTDSGEQTRSDGGNVAKGGKV